MAKRRQPPKRRSRAKRGRARTRRRGVQLAVPQLSQRQRDFAGLAVIAFGIFSGFLFYANSGGGIVGEQTVNGLQYLIGAVAYLFPFVAVFLGALLIARPMVRTTTPAAIGIGLIVLGLTLAFAGGTLGLGDGVRQDFWQADFFKQRGGIIGEASFYAASNLFEPLGAHILAIFLFLAGLLLLTGASLAGVLRGAGTGLTTASRQLSTVGSELSAVIRKDQKPREAALPSTPLLPPEPAPAELVVRATHVEANPVDEFSSPPARDSSAEPAFADRPEGEDSDATQALEVPEPKKKIKLSKQDLTPQGNLRDSITDAADFPWQLPDAAFLKHSSSSQAKPDVANQDKVATQLVEALGHFGVEAKVVGMVTGPHITRYELKLAPGIKVGKITQLKDDLAYALAATDIRILAPIPGKQAVGVEVPNTRRRIVHLGDVFQDPPADWSALSVWLGKDVAGRAIGADLAKMPHLLVAGTTGSGKSGCVNAMLSSILLRATPRDVRVVLVDPKQVELNHYESIPHLLTPVITSPRMAANALQNLVKEMEQRYGLMSLARARKLTELNAIRETRDEPPLPHILCVIDELADLMMVAPAEVEDSIIRLAQKARAVGIHLVLATQSPRVDVITGMIKANVPSRIAFAVSSQTDSRVILDQNGAESLLGQGDMLFAPIGSSKLQRIQGAYIDERQIATLTDWWSAQAEPEFHAELLEEVESDSSSDRDGENLDPDEDPVLEQAITLVAEMGTASTSMLQRRLRLGYTRAGRVIDMLERRGIISGYEGSKPRQVLITEADLPRVLATVGGDSEESAERTPDTTELAAVDAMTEVND